MDKLFLSKNALISLLIVVCISCLFPKLVQAQDLTLHNKKQSGFYLVSGSDFNSLLVKDPEAFKNIDQISLGGLSLDYLQIKKITANRPDKRQINRSWNIGDTYKEILQKAYLKQANRVFTQESAIKLTSDNNKDSLTVMFLLTEFKPDIVLNPTKSFGTADSVRKIGDAKFRIVIQNASNKDIVAVMDGQAAVTNGQLVNNSNVGHSNAWEGSFYDWHKYLLETMVGLKSLK